LAPQQLQADATMTNIVTSLQELSPITFENLVFDLMQSLGVENLTWRTPGADGGRDIEGDLPARDLSGGLVYQRWFIECKRYTSSIDWPTVWGKAAYAQNGGADFLLIVTTSTLSPTCESEVTKWNLRRERPVIRAWRAYDLERMLGQFSAVATKYGLSTSGDGEGKAFQDLAFEAAKLIQSAYSAAEFEVDSSIYLEAAAALAELLSARMDEVSNYGSIKLAVRGRI